MDNALQPLLELSRDPVLAVADGKIRLMNSAACAAFPGFRVGDSAAKLIPDCIAFETTAQFVSAAVVCGVRHTISAVRCDGVLFLTLIPDPPPGESRGFLSEKQMCGLMSTLFNIGMAVDRIENAATSVSDIDTYLPLLSHSYHALLRRMNNLNMLCSYVGGNLEIIYRHFDLVELCTDLVSSIRLILRERFAPVEFSTELAALPVCMDASKIERLILNLLSNSLLHTPADGLVRLRLARSGSNALISVSDNGEGIPSSKLKTVFSGFRNPVELGAPDADHGGGLGLGLCRAVAETHGGTLILESREGEGTDVRVLLPLSPPGAADLKSGAPEYENGGMRLILTELSDLLDAGAYRNSFSEK